MNIIKLCVFLPLATAFFMSCDHYDTDKREYHVVVNKITNGGLDEWYEVQEQYISRPCTDKIHYASAYLCIDPRTNDTILIVSPCNKNRFKKHAGVALYVYKNVVMGDTLTIEIPKRYERFLHQERTMSFGILQIPID